MALPTSDPVEYMDYVPFVPTLLTIKEDKRVVTAVGNAFRQSPLFKACITPTNFPKYYRFMVISELDESIYQRFVHFCSESHPKLKRLFIMMFLLTTSSLIMYAIRRTIDSDEISLYSYFSAAALLINKVLGYTVVDVNWDKTIN